MPSAGLFLAPLLVAILMIAAVRWQRTLIMALPILVTLNGLTIPLAGVSMRLDQLGACLLVVPLVAAALIGARRIRTDGTVWWLAGILVCNLLASALNSPARSYSLTQCVNLASVWVIYVLLINALDSRELLERFLRRVLWAAVFASTAGTIAYLLAVGGVPAGGAETSALAAERLTMAYGAYGTMVEPNILGSYTAASLVLAVALLVTAPRDASGTKVRLARTAAASSAIALVLTFTRGAWIGAAVGLLAIAVLGAGTLATRTVVRRVSVVAVAAASVVAVLLILPGDAGTLFRFKVANLVNIGSQTGVVRLLSYTMALQQAVVHPIVGWGTFTFAPLAAQGADFQQFDNWRNLWIGNYLLLAAHDTGAIGLLLWIGMLGGIARASWVSARALVGSDSFSASRLIGLTAAVVTLLVAFLATSGFSFGYSWLLLGFLGAYRRVIYEERVQAAA